MRLLVTGAAGFIGQHVVRQAVTAGHSVTAVLRPGIPAARLAALPPQASIRELDLEDARAVAFLVEERAPVVVLHLAWHTNPADYLTADQNVDCLRLTSTFARTALASGCSRFVGVGSCLEYAPSASPHDEADPADPGHLYAAAKLAAWLMVRALAARRRVPAAWARVFHLHGPGEHPRRLVPTVRAALRAGRPIDLTAGEQVRDHLHVSDVAAGLLRIADSDVHGVVNVCSGRPVTLRAVLTALADLEGGRELLRFGARPYAADEPMYLLGSCGRLLALGWRPQYGDLRESFADRGVP